MFTNSTHGRSRTFASLALLALVLLQVSWASHQSQHALGDLAEPCSVCVHLDSNDVISGAQASALLPPAPTVAVAVFESIVVGTTPFAQHRPRAPPHSLI